MKRQNRSSQIFILAVALSLSVILSIDAIAQERVQIAYSSTDTINQPWTVAYEAGFFKKHGLDVELVYIGSTTVAVTAIIAQDIQVGNAAGVGAKAALLSRKERQRARQIVRRTGYIELTTYPGFSRRFALSLYFPPDGKSN